MKPKDKLKGFAKEVKKLNDRPVKANELFITIETKIFLRDIDEKGIDGTIKVEDSDG